jgi:membrane fusion protein (multidrug efflux system)
MRTNYLIISMATLLLALSATPARPAEEPSVVVTTELLTRHSLVDSLVGYGTVAPATGRVKNVSSPYGGHVTALRVSPGQTVKRGEALIEVETEPAATLAYRQAAAAVEYGRNELGRVEELAQQQLATRSQVAAAKKSLTDAQLQLHEQARLGAGRRATTFRAPFDGVVTSLSVALGERITANKTLLQLARTDQLLAQIGIEPADAMRIRPGMAVQLVSVFDARNAVAAKVTRVHGMIDPQTQLVDVVVSFRSDAASGLLPGTRVRGDVAVGNDNSWAVPRQAVLRDAHGAYLFQVKGGRAQRVDVTVGIESGDLIGVSGALDATQPVVVLGNYELKDGMKVRGHTP